MLVQAQAEKQRRKADSTKLSAEELKEEEEDKGISIDPKTYCKLGHFHLLLEDYHKGTILCVLCFIIKYKKICIYVNTRVNFFLFFFYSNVCISEVLFFKR